MPEHRDLLLASFFSLLSLVMLDRARGTSGTRPVIWALAAFLASVLSHESALGLPLLFVALSWIEGQPVRARQALALGLAFAFAFGISILLGGEAAGDKSGLLVPVGSALQLVALGTLDCVFPWKLSPAYGDMPGDWPGALLMLFGLALVLTPLILLLRARRVDAPSARKPLSLAFAWFVISLVPFWLLPFEVERADRYLYFASGGVCLGLGWTANRLAARWHHRGRVMAPLLALLLVFSIACVRQSLLWLEQTRVWERAAAQAPKRAEVWLRLSAAYLRSGDSRALEASRRGLELAPESGALMSVQGVRLAQEGKLERAREVLEHALSYSSTRERSRIYNNLGAIHASKGDHGNAETAFRKGLEYDASAFKLHRNLGLSLKALGRDEEALASIKRAIELAPYDRQSVRAFLALAPDDKELP